MASHSLHPFCSIWQNGLEVKKIMCSSTYTCETSSWIIRGLSRLTLTPSSVHPERPSRWLWVYLSANVQVKVQRLHIHLSYASGRQKLVWLDPPSVFGLIPVFRVLPLCSEVLLLPLKRLQRAGVTITQQQWWLQKIELLVSFLHVSLNLVWKPWMANEKIISAGLIWMVFSSRICDVGVSVHQRF